MGRDEWFPGRCPGLARWAGQDIGSRRRHTVADTKLGLAIASEQHENMI